MVLLDDAGDMGFQLPCQKTPDTLPESADVSLGEAVLLMARRGGYLNRKNEAPPGHQVVWTAPASEPPCSTENTRFIPLDDQVGLHSYG